MKYLSFSRVFMAITGLLTVVAPWSALFWIGPWTMIGIYWMGIRNYHRNEQNMQLTEDRLLPGEHSVLIAQRNPKYSLVHMAAIWTHLELTDRRVILYGNAPGVMHREKSVLLDRIIDVQATSWWMTRKGTADLLLETAAGPGPEYQFPECVDGWQVRKAILAQQALLCTKDAVSTNPEGA